MKKRSGFTLIELIIVVIIIAILAAVAVPLMQNIRAKTIYSEAIVGMSSIRNAVRQYYAEHQQYPKISSRYNGRLVSVYKVAGASFFSISLSGINVSRRFAGNLC